MKCLQVWLVSIVILMMTSCAVHYELFTEAEGGTNFRDYVTFSIIENTTEIGMPIDTSQRIQFDKAIEEEFEDIGYLLSNDPDLKIAWFIKEDTALEPGVYNAYYSKWRSPKAMQVYEYQMGSLVLDIIDTSTEKIIWHGRVSGRIDKGELDIEREIQKIIKEMFKSYKKDTGIKKVNAYASK